MICLDGQIAIQCFSLMVILFLILFELPANINTLLVYNWNNFVNPIIFYILMNVFIRVIYCRVHKVAIRAAFLGQAFILGIYIFHVTPQHVHMFGLYMSVISFFHFSEYLTIAIIQPKELTPKSFMLSHSVAYIGAAVASWLEFGLESYFLPDMKTFPYVPFIGFAICLIGEVVRKLAMFTAAKNFNHLVQDTKAVDHTLIMHGIYGWFRHPSYVGWFYWAIGTQIILLNPVCIVLYTIMSWMFFRERIYFEEITLLNFFGQAYYEYQEQVGTGLPLIKGYIIRP